MSGIIEVQRALLEESNALEEGISRRFLRNPKLLPKNLIPKHGDLLIDSNQSQKRKTKKRNNRNYSKRLVLLQQQELRLFLDRYKDILKSTSRINSGGKQNLGQVELGLLTEKDSFDKFDALLAKVHKPQAVDEEYGQDNIMALNPREEYSSFYTNDPSDIQIKERGKLAMRRREVKYVKKKCILSKAASHLQLAQNTLELDLKPFHTTFNQLTQKNISYVEYLYTFATTASSTNYDSVQFLAYLESLSGYLWRIYCNLNPLESHENLLKSLQEEFSKRISGINEEANDDDKADSLYCEACAKKFSNKAVYDGHLLGKKHKKNAAGAGAGAGEGIGAKGEREGNISNESSSTAANVAQAKTSTNTKVFRGKPWYSFLLLKLFNMLKSEIAIVEKTIVLSERERLIELKRTEDLENELTAVEDSDFSGSDNDGNGDDDNDNSGSDSDLDLELFKNLPMGPDGTPIPLWLYKMQGLHKVHVCEICGNATYQGKKAFTRHFNGTKNLYGLQCLGIDEEHSMYFKNVTSIDEARNLWSNLKKESRTKLSEVQNAIEVEDKNGNVLNEHDYIELKRQGLI